MKKLIKASKGNYPATLILDEGDLAVLKLFKNKTIGSVSLTISAASIDQDVIFVTRKDGIYEVQKRDLPQ